MSAIVYQHQTVPSPLVRHSRFGMTSPSQPDRDVLCSPPHRPTQHLGADTVCLIDVSEWFSAGVASASSSASAQIPIAL